MQMIFRRRILFLLAFGCFVANLCNGQDIEKRISPLALATAKYKDSYIKVTYGQPSKRNRPIFGALVPYGQVWRTGANEATEITFTRDVSISNKTISAGIYTLFTIPNPTQWTVILNREVGLWGSYNYNPKSDVERWEVPVQKLADRSIEVMSIQLDSKNNKVNLNVCWDDTCVSLPILFNEPK